MKPGPPVTKATAPRQSSSPTSFVTGRQTSQVLHLAAARSRAGDAPLPAVARRVFVHGLRCRAGYADRRRSSGSNGVHRTPPPHTAHVAPAAARPSVID